MLCTRSILYANESNIMRRGGGNLCKSPFHSVVLLVSCAYNLHIKTNGPACGCYCLLRIRSKRFSRRRRIGLITATTKRTRSLGSIQSALRKMEHAQMRGNPTVLARALCVPAIKLYIYIEYAYICNCSTTPKTVHNCGHA